MKQIITFIALIISLSGYSQTITIDEAPQDEVILLSGELISFIDTGSTQPPDKILFTLRQKGIIVYYTDLSTLEIEAEEGTIYVEVYPSSTKVFGIITKEIFPSRHLVLGATYYQDTEVTKEQIIKFIPDGK